MAYSAIEDNEMLRRKIAEWQSLLEDCTDELAVRTVLDEMEQVLEE